MPRAVLLEPPAIDRASPPPEKEPPMRSRVLSRRSVRSIAIFLPALSSTLIAQTGSIIGRVTDAATQRPLADVRLAVAGTTLSTLTNAQGEYRLVNLRPGLTTVTAFHLGYKAAGDTVRLTAGKTDTLNFGLSASLVTLSELVITGTAGNQERRAQSAQVASISAAQI